MLSEKPMLPKYSPEQIVLPIMTVFAVPEQTVDVAINGYLGNRDKFRSDVVNGTCVVDNIDTLQEVRVMQPSMILKASGSLRLKKRKGAEVGECVNLGGQEGAVILLIGPSLGSS